MQSRDLILKLNAAERKYTDKAIELEYLVASLQDLRHVRVYHFDVTFAKVVGLLITLRRLDRKRLRYSKRYAEQLNKEQAS